MGIGLFIATVLLVVGASLARFKKRKASLTSAGPNLDVNLWVRVAVSLIVLAGALYVILSNHFEDEQQKWASGSIGTILGYWLKV